MQNDAKTFLKHFSDCLFYFCSTCADSIMMIMTRVTIKYNGHFLDKSNTNPLEFSSGFVLDLSKTCPLVASADTDLSVSGMS